MGDIIKLKPRHDPADHVAEAGESILARAAQISVLAGFVVVCSAVLLAEATLLAGVHAAVHARRSMERHKWKSRSKKLTEKFSQ